MLNKIRRLANNVRLARQYISKPQLMTKYKEIEKTQDFKQIVQETQQMLQQKKKMSDFDILTILNGLHRIQHKDNLILSEVADMIKANKITKINSLTNILYIFAKFGFRDEEVLQKAVQIMNKEFSDGNWNTFSIKIVSRNFWNFYELSYYDETLFNYFCEMIAQNQGSLNHQDTANALQSLSTFEHLNYDAMGRLIENTIENCNVFSFQSLAIVCNSLADLGVKNQALFKNVSKILVRKEKRMNPPDQVDYRAFLEPIDCAQLMTAFCRSEIFDHETLYLLQHNFMLGKKQSSETLITMYCAHQTWVQHMKQECESEKNHKLQKQYSKFKNESLTFQKQMLDALLSSEDLNIKGIFLILSQPDPGQVKKRENKRLIFQLALRGVDILKDQQALMIGQNLGNFADLPESDELWLQKYYQTSKNFCLNSEDETMLVDKFNQVFPDKQIS